MRDSKCLITMTTINNTLFRTMILIAFDDDLSLMEVVVKVLNSGG